MSSKYHITGASSGLGKFLLHELDANRITRDKESYKISECREISKIIHCGSGRISKELNSDAFIKEQLSLFESLLDLKHDKFIYISSIDVLSNRMNPYIYVKKNIEEQIIQNFKDFLIIRPCLLFGKGMIPNQALKIATGFSSRVTLTMTSTFGLVWYDDILKVIDEDLSGIINVIPEKLVSLNQLANYFSREVLWGDFEYLTPQNLPCDNIEKNLIIKGDSLSRLKNFIKTSK